ncbi:hypothetical protein H5410_016151 [Solanum commersonii]|uniref:Uncharacterized protein n=1 Tax=Solanum commersonii TaxID=4109 RepID=A0A9J5ZWR1_SOLCO|nr:hypothetical protein H5410_016151 [Solanum commersonii]
MMLQGPTFTGYLSSTTLIGRYYGGTPPLTQRLVHPDVSPSSTSTPSATPDDTMPAFAPGQKDRLGRVMIESDGSSWNPVKDVARALKDCVRRLYTHAYHSWSEIPNSSRQAMFNNFKTMCTWESMYNLVNGTTFERKASARLSSWLKKVWDSSKRPSWMLPHVFDELGIGSSRQAEALDGVQIAAMLDQIAKLTAALAQSEWRRVAEQESMSEFSKLKNK